MTLISEIMSKDVRVLKPEDSLQTAAQTMNKMNVGAIPVCDGNRLVGMITDRDIIVRGVAYGQSSNTSIQTIMSGDVSWCFEDDQIEDVSEKMSDIQVRRIPVVNHKKELVGIVSLGDLAARHSSQTAAKPLKNISGNSDPMRTGGASLSDITSNQAVS